MLEKKTIFIALEMIFCAISVGLIFFSKEFPLLAVMVLYSQSIVSCLKSLDANNDLNTNIVDVVALFAEAMLLFFSIGAYNGSEILIMIVKYGSLVCFARTMIILFYWLAKESKQQRR